MSGVSFLMMACGNQSEPSESLDTDTDDQVPMDDATEESQGEPQEEPQEEPAEDQSAELSQEIEDWLPRRENVYYSYSEEGTPIFDEYPQFTSENTMQITTGEEGSKTVRIYEYSEEQVEESFVRENTNFRDDFSSTGLSSDAEAFEIIIQTPIEVGHSWESPSGSISEITDSEVEVDTPLGMYETIEITRTYPNGEAQIQYFAQDVGLVLQETDYSTRQLSEIRKDVPEVLTFNLYESASNEDGSKFGVSEDPIEVELYTNEPIRLALEEVFRENLFGFEEAGRINFMYMTDEGIPHIDFNEVVTEDITLGSSGEPYALMAFTHTIADYYDVNQIRLTVDGEVWFSPHIQLQQELIDVPFDEIIE